MTEKTFSPAVTDEATTPAGGVATAGTGRLGNLDVLRGVAALVVIGVHAYVLGGRPVPLKAEQPTDILLISAVAAAWLFFAISAYVIGRPFVAALACGKPLPDVVPYGVKRVLRIFPLYWITLTVVILVAGAGASRAWQLPVHYAGLHNLVPGRQSAIFSPAWTLTLEVIFYALLPLIALALRRYLSKPTPERLARILLISFVASVAFAFFAGLQDGMPGVWLRGSLPAMWQMFCPGLLLALAPHLRDPRWRRWLVDLPNGRWAPPLIFVTFAVAALLGATAPLNRGVEVYQVITDLSRPVFAVSCWLIVAWAIRVRPWRLRALLHVGMVSYGTYVIHTAILYFLVSDLGDDLVPLPHGGPAAHLVHFALLAGITILLATASWHWLEQPCIRLGRALGQRWRERAPGYVAQP